MKKPIVAYVVLLGVLAAGSVVYESSSGNGSDESVSTTTTTDSNCPTMPGDGKSVNTPGCQPRCWAKDGIHETACTTEDLAVKAGSDHILDKYGLSRLQSTCISVRTDGWYEFSDPNANAVCVKPQPASLYKGSHCVVVPDAVTYGWFKPGAKCGSWPYGYGPAPTTTTTYSTYYPPVTSGVLCDFYLPGGIKKQTHQSRSSCTSMGGFPIG